MAMSRHEAITRTPADMLPVELILSILPLTRPCSSVPLASRLLASALDFPPSTATAKSDPSKSICFGWVRRRLAQSTHWTCAGFLHSSPIQPENTRVPCLCVRCVLVELRPAVYWYPSQSAVDSYKGLLPARFKAALCDTWVVRKSFVDYMLCRCYGMDEKQLAEELSLLGSSTGNRVGARYLPESPLLDMLFLAVFYLRSRNVELLRYTLDRLDDEDAYPEFADIDIPLDSWSNLSEAIDDLQVAGELYLCSETAGVTPTPFTHFLLILAASQWSVPLVSTICDSLYVHPADFLDWPLFRSDVFDVMVNQLRFVPKYLSPGAMCRWLYDNGFEPDSESHASIAPAAGTRSHFLDVFHEHDDGYLFQVTRRSDEHHHLYWRCELLGMLWLLEGSANRLTSFDSDDDSVSDGEKWFW